MNFIGQDYQKYIELFNLKISETYGRDTSVNYFDCTNYYFEIDLEDGLRRKGPSKEGRHSPIIGQALLLDREQIPLGMTMYPGNQSEKPFIRKMIEDTKSRYDIGGRTIQIADKGLNCAKNIHSAVKESNDGYIFSKSIHGKNLSEAERRWILLEDDGANRWTSIYDKKGNVVYKFKSCVDEFEYGFKDEDGAEKRFAVREKRVVSYNPGFAKKQRLEILKEAEKARRAVSIKSFARDVYGDMSKYIDFTAKTKGGEKARIASSVNEEKINEDLKYAGYNLLVSSEIDADANEIYKAYHGLWRIEESFRIMKSYLEARPVYLQKEESIYGHFTICYLALTVLRLLELKVFKDELPVSRIVEFIRDYRVTDTGEGLFINNATKSQTFLAIKEKLGLSKLGNLALKKRDIDSLLNATL